MNDQYVINEKARTVTVCLFDRPFTPWTFPFREVWEGTPAKKAYLPEEAKFLFAVARDELEERGLFSVR